MARNDDRHLVFYAGFNIRKEVRALSLKQLSKEELSEMSFIELAQELLEEKKQTMDFHDLVNEISNLLDLSEEEKRKKMVQFYTDMNVDGSFLNLGDNMWGLRTWYPVDQIDEEVTHTTKVKKKKVKVVDEDDDFDDDFEEDLDFDEIDEIDEDDDFIDEDEDDIEDEDFDDIDEDEDFEDDDLIAEDEYDLSDEDDEEEEADANLEERDKD